AEVVGATQPNISAILAGKVDGLSVERLMRILNALDHDVHLVVLPKSVRARRASANVFACRSESIADSGVS
ncbi:MAG: XRE family transcriptional regulator, partial [Actinomycetota bacterium]|nr:XRE family transcriptional regulator [Actinomycetota bacterium]